MDIIKLVMVIGAIPESAKPVLRKIVEASASTRRRRHCAPRSQADRSGGTKIQSIRGLAPSSAGHVRSPSHFLWKYSAIYGSKGLSGSSKMLEKSLFC